MAQVEAVADFLGALSPRLLAALEQGIRRVQAVDRLPSVPPFVQLSEPWGHVASTLAEVAEAEAEAWESQDRVMHMRLDYDAARGRRRLLTVSSGTAHVLSLHREEVVGRMAARDLPLLGCDEDQLRRVFVELVFAQLDDVEVFGRMVPFHGPEFAKLFTHRLRRSFDPTGRIRAVQHVMRVITPEEYDHLLRRCSQYSIHACTGDNRSGAQLLADAKADSRRRLSALVANPRPGRDRMAPLAAGLEALVAAGPPPSARNRAPALAARN